MTTPRARNRDVGEMDAIFWDLRRTCALGRVLHAGCGEGEFVARLIEHGVDAAGVDFDVDVVERAQQYVPGRCHCADGFAWPFDAGVFQTVVCLDASIFESGAERFAREIRRVATHHVFLRLTPGATEARWMSVFFRAGFRRHPAAFRVSPGANGDRWLLFERLPDESLLEGQRRLVVGDDLDDALVQIGANADRRLRQYARAAALVRPNDTVLDLSCGTGFGLAIVATTGRARRLIGLEARTDAVAYATRMYGAAAEHLEFHAATPHALGSIADQSVDLVIGFDPIGGAARQSHLARQIGRILKPGGRFIGITESERVQDTLAPHFVIEHVEASEDARTLVVAMKDPRTGIGIPYVEAVHAIPTGSYRPASVTFADAYDNPWIRNAIVSQGIRISDRSVLAATARGIEDGSFATSVDRAAALCVQGYGLLTAATAGAAHIGELVDRIARWIDAAAGPPRSPHHLRWRISLEYLAGRLYLLAGRRDDALDWFERCAAEDACRFSPLLATKTIDAAFTAGVMHAWSGRRDRARRWWTAGLDQARRACAHDWREIVGDDQRPCGFGLRELGEALDYAARCAAGLNALDVWDTAPGRLADLLAGDSRSDAERVRELETGRELRALRAQVPPRRVTPHTHAHTETPILAPVMPAERLVIYTAGADGRRLWESLATRPGVDVIAFVDTDVRRQGRDVFGLPVHSPDWLRDGDWDRVAVATGRSTEWRFVLAAVGVSVRQCLELPGAGDAEALARACALAFPDPFTSALSSVERGQGRQVGIFGTGAAGLKIWEALTAIDDADAVWFADNNASQQGTQVLGLDVIAPAAIAARGYDAVVIGSMSRDPIRRQLMGLGVPLSSIWTPDVGASVDHIREQLVTHIVR